MKIDAWMILTFTTIGIMAVILVAMVYLEKRERNKTLRSLSDEFDEMFAKMQTPEHKEGMHRAFDSFGKKEDRELTAAELVERIVRGQEIDQAITKARANGVYETAEHLTSELDIWKKKS